MSLPRPGTLWRTLRHLRFRQIRYQVTTRLLPKATPRPLPMRWRAVEARLPRFKNTLRSFLVGEAFTFNNETRVAPGWNEADARKLWLYNLHYMSWLFDLDSFEAREAWIDRWIQANGRATGGTGWEPYPVSLRLFNWSKHYAMSGRAPSSLVLGSLAEQSAWLLANLEFHLDGNHLLENLLALAHVGLFWDDSDRRAATAQRKVQRLLEEALQEQFLADGGHYELSPMYHAILLERLLDLLNVWPRSNDPFPGLRPTLEGRAREGLDWLDVMSVAGNFALFNDAAYDTAPNAGALLDYGARLLGWSSKGRAPLRALPASGYYRGEAGPFTVIFDAGRLGPDRQMGHAQGDLLSFCLWFNDVLVVTNPGNFEYVGGAMRDYCRATASHSTVAIPGMEQAEWWGSHRVGRRASPLQVQAEDDGARVLMRGGHDGFTRQGGPLHFRTLELSASGLTVRDRLSAPHAGARAMLQIAPECRVVIDSDDARVNIPSGEMLHLRASAPLTAESAWHCPEFGLRLPATALAVPFESTEATVEISTTA